MNIWQKYQQMAVPRWFDKHRTARTWFCITTSVAFLAAMLILPNTSSDSAPPPESSQSVSIVTVSEQCDPSTTAYPECLGSYQESTNSEIGPNCNPTTSNYPECLAPDNWKEAKHQMKHGKWNVLPRKAKFFKHASHRQVRYFGKLYKKARHRDIARYAEGNRITFGQAENQIGDRYILEAKFRAYTTCGNWGMKAKFFTYMPGYCSDDYASHVPKYSDWKYFKDIVVRLNFNCRNKILIGIAKGGVVAAVLGVNPVWRVVKGAAQGYAGCVGHNFYKVINKDRPHRATARS